jgi:hypothetical protein
METAIQRPRSGNLTAALVAVALLELIVNRLFGRLFSQAAAFGSAPAGFRPASVLGASGPFLFQLTAVLALGVLVAAFSGLVRRGELYHPRTIRFSVVVIALFFIGFATSAVIRGQMPARHFVFLEIGFAFLALLTLLAVTGARVPARARAGIALFAAPGVLRAFAVFMSGRGPGAAEAAALAGAGEIALLVAGVLAPLTLVTRPWKDRRWLLPLVSAVLLTTALLVALSVRFDLVQASVLYGLRIDLPRLGSPAGIAHVAAFFGWSFTTVELIAAGGGLRLAGYGLLLLALGGYETGSPVELTLSLLGLIALAVGELRATPRGEGAAPSARVPSAEWRAFIGRLRNAVDDQTGPADTRPEAVVVEEGKLEASRIRCYRRGYPVSIKLQRTRGVVDELEATVGSIGHGIPDASLERHRRWLARSLEHRLKRERSKTGDADFDQKFSIHGEAPLTDEGLRRRVSQLQGDGVLTVWNGTAARYTLTHPSADSEKPPVFSGNVDGSASDAVVQLIDMLADLIEASLPSAS